METMAYAHGIKISLFPENFPHADRGDLINACGVLPRWASQVLAIVQVAKQNNDVENVHPVEMMEMFYGFPIHESKGSKMLNQLGHYQYPGDPVEKPIMCCELDGDPDWKFFFYTSANLAIPKGDGTYFFTRMD